MEIRKGRLWARYGFGLLVMLMLLPALPAAAQDAPPAWSAGQWWVVESQVYNQGKIRRGAQPGWEPKVRWRFQVEGTENLGGEPCYVVAVTPAEGNKYPYSFKYYFREADRSIARRDLIHPANSGDIGPQVVTQNIQSGFSLTAHEAPTLPVNLPVFGTQPQAAAGAGPLSLSRATQTAQKVDAAALQAKANPALLAKMGGALSGSNNLVKIAKPSGVAESQYWNADLPWCVYGEQFDKTYTSRRYWLVDTGK
jgi:hypothetical protein